MRPIVSFALAAAVAAGALASPASTQTLTPDQVLRIHFKVNTPFNTTPNTLKLNFGMLKVNAPYTTRRADLWDCDRLLGSYASTLFGTYSGALNLDPAASWTSPTSPWTFDNAAVVDFSTIQSGTIRGIIDFTIDTGSITLNVPGINLSMIRATGSSGGSVVSPNPTITEIAIVPRLTGPTPGVAGTTNTWTVTGAQPSSIEFFGFGVTCGPIPVLGVTYDIVPVIFVPAPTDPAGMAALSLPVPASASMQRVLVQGVQIVGGSSLEVTNISEYTFP